MHKIHKSVVESYLLPSLIELKPNLFAAKYYLMKLVPAKFIIEEGLNNGDIDPETVIVESTSGTFGLALALVCNQYNLKLILISDPAIDYNLRSRLQDLGAEIHICNEPEKVGGYQSARIKRLEKELTKHPKVFWPKQYSNPMNPGAYSIFAEQVLSQFGDSIDFLVGSVGSGGSMSGSLSSLRTFDQNLQGIAVDSRDSMLFGRADLGANRIIRGLGNSLMPENLDHSLFDQVHWLSSKSIVNFTHQLHREYGLFCGPTSGATFGIANFLSEIFPDKKILFICADSGYRYYRDIYNLEWMTEKGMIDSGSADYSPIEVQSPLDDFGDNDWCYMNWNRKSFDEVSNKNGSRLIVV